MEEDEDDFVHPTKQRRSPRLPHNYSTPPSSPNTDTVQMVVVSCEGNGKGQVHTIAESNFSEGVCEAVV